MIAGSLRGEGDHRLQQYVRTRLDVRPAAARVTVAGLPTRGMRRRRAITENVLAQPESAITVSVEKDGRSARYLHFSPGQTGVELDRSQDWYAPAGCVKWLLAATLDRLGEIDSH